MSGWNEGGVYHSDQAHSWRDGNRPGDPDSTASNHTIQQKFNEFIRFLALVRKRGGAGFGEFEDEGHWGHQRAGRSGRRRHSDSPYFREGSCIDEVARGTKHIKAC